MVAAADATQTGRMATVIRLPHASRDRQLSLFRVCVNCGSTLSRYNADDDDLCQSCRRKWQESPEYDPRADPEFVGEVATLLMQHLGRRIAVGRVLGADVWVVGEAVKELRRRGFVIHAKKGKPGYRMVGWRRPEAETN